MAAKSADCQRRCRFLRKFRLQGVKNPAELFLIHLFLVREITQDVERFQVGHEMTNVASLLLINILLYCPSRLSDMLSGTIDLPAASVQRYHDVEVALKVPLLGCVGCAVPLESDLLVCETARPQHQIPGLRPAAKISQSLVD